MIDGAITASIGVVDPRNQEDMAAAPGDFSAIDDNDEEVMLSTAGMLRPSFTDSSNNKLRLSKNIIVRIDAEQLSITDDATYYQWYLNQKTGRWIKFGPLRTGQGVSRGKRRAPRTFFVGEITPNVPYDGGINWDRVDLASYVRVKAPQGTVVTRIGLTEDILSYTTYRQESVPSSGILCILSLRDRPAVLQAELDGAPLIPQEAVSFPSAVNPLIIDGSSAGNVFNIKSFQFTSTQDGQPGPIYYKSGSARCRQQRPGDLAFQFQEDTPDENFHWESPRSENPIDPAFWEVRLDEICFVKAVVSGTRPDSVIYVKSTGKAPGQPTVEYGYTAEKSALVGSQGVVCLEYRCNEGFSGLYQTHLQVLTLTGSCTLQSLNNVLASRQDQCQVQPDGDSSQEQNFCVPSDLEGGDASLYSGDRTVAKGRCLRGNNRYNGVVATATTLNPTITLTCN